MQKGNIPELSGYAHMHAPHSNELSKFVNFILSGNGLRKCYVSIIPVLKVKGNIAFYPHHHVNKGLEHMALLTNLIREGHRAAILFLTHRADADTLQLDPSADSQYCEALVDALQRDVESFAYNTKVTPKDISLYRRMAFPK